MYTVDSVLDGMSSFANDLKQVRNQKIHFCGYNKEFIDVQCNPKE
jgi:hypothetical protein